MYRKFMTQNKTKQKSYSRAHVNILKNDILLKTETPRDQNIVKSTSTYSLLTEEDGEWRSCGDGRGWEFLMEWRARKSSKEWLLSQGAG